MAKKTIQEKIEDARRAALAAEAFKSKSPFLYSEWEKKQKAFNELVKKELIQKALDKK